MMAQIHFMPYRRTGGMNSLEAVQLSCCCLVLFVGLLFYGEVRVFPLADSLVLSSACAARPSRFVR